MAIHTWQLKVHSRTDITKDFEGRINPCVIHAKIPEIQKVVSGRKKDVDYVCFCKSDECTKMSDSAKGVVAIWNEWNPKP